MNYNSIDEILSAGTTNMTIIRNNSKQDDGVDSVTGVSWFTFNNITASTIYANGNSWIGFGSSSEHLKVNRRDCAMWCLYREEGTLYDHYNFLKIRWKGYSYYSQTSSSYALEYDVILWDTGDISLHMVTIPTSYNNGTYALVASSTYNYTVSNDSPDVTFIKTDAGFEVQNNVINLVKPPEHRYLIRDGSTIYTVSSNSLVSLGDVSLTADLFLNSGIKEFVEFTLLNNLSAPELLYWHETTDNVSTLTVKGTPPLPQTVVYEQQTIPSGSQIKIMEAVATDDVLFTITFDGGTTWSYYSGNAWASAESVSQGMTQKVLKTITESTWAEVATSDTYQVRCALPSTTSKVSKIAVGYTD